MIYPTTATPTAVTELIHISYDDTDKPTVSGRELHQALEVNTRYNDWFPRMCEYGFTDGIDFYSFLSKTSENGRPATDHALTIDMAKELCMIQRTDKGKQCRQYFLEIERQWNSPEAVMARALKLADRKLIQAKEEIQKLQIQVSGLTVENQIMKPKADYFDDLVDRNLLTNIRDTAKELGIKQKKFVEFLLENKYLYRDSKKKLKPYAKHVENGLFEIKEFHNEVTGYVDVQTLITPKGRETFRLLILGA